MRRYEIPTTQNDQGTHRQRSSAVIYCSFLKRLSWTCENTSEPRTRRVPEGRSVVLIWMHSLVPNTQFGTCGPPHATCSNPTNRTNNCGLDARHGRLTLVCTHFITSKEAGKCILILHSSPLFVILHAGRTSIGSQWGSRRLSIRSFNRWELYCGRWEKGIHVKHKRQVDSPGFASKTEDVRRSRR